MGEWGPLREEKVFKEVHNEFRGDVEKGIVVLVPSVVGLHAGGYSDKQENLREDEPRANAEEDKGQVRRSWMKDFFYEIYLVHYKALII